MNTMTKDGLRNLRLETLYQTVEAAFGAVRSRIVSGLQGHQTDVDAIVHFAAAQMVRTPKFRGYWHFIDSVSRQGLLSSFADPAMQSELEATLRNLKANQQQLLSLMTFPKALELLSDMRVQLFKAPEPRTFVTSDSPCCVIDYKEPAQSVFERLAGPTVNVLMPLSPDIVVLFDRSKEPHEMIQVSDGHPFLDSINAIIWSGSDSRVVLPRDKIQPEWLNVLPSRSGEEYSVL